MVALQIVKVLNIQVYLRFALGDTKEKLPFFAMNAMRNYCTTQVIMPEDLEVFSNLVKSRCLDEEVKSEDRSKLGGRVKLLHEIISQGLKAVESKSS
ncbi:MAG: hypothetical protein K9L30_17245 [Desulfobacterales bacterium]|nr:hypothetical protein [Desulfobacterales bacterium]